LIIWVILGFVLEPKSDLGPNLASIAYWTTFGVWIGAVGRASAIRKQLRTEERHL
jgi:hypothetical protein